MSIAKVVMTSLLFLAGINQAPALVVVQQAVPVVPVNPFCTAQAAICHKTCVGPFCATECSDYLTACAANPTIVWEHFHHGWHHRGHWHGHHHPHHHPVPHHHHHHAHHGHHH